MSSSGSQSPDRLSASGHSSTANSDTNSHSAHAQHQQQPFRARTSAHEAFYATGGANMKTRLSSSAGAQDFVAAAAAAANSRFRSTSNHDAARPNFFQFQDGGTSLSMSMRAGMANTMFMRGIGSRTGMGLLAIQSPCRKPAPRSPALGAVAQSKGPVVALPSSVGLLQQKEEKDLDGSDSSGGSCSRSGAGVERGGGGITGTGGILSPSPIKSQNISSNVAKGGSGNSNNITFDSNALLMSSTGSMQQQGIVWAKGKKLGNGAFGSVFSALDLKTGK